ncbi:MAG: radical SAM protein [Thermoplasmataceae archaeon]
MDQLAETGGREWVPSIIFMELTKSCEYSCRHCRASAQLDPSPDELSLDELKNVIRSINGLGENKPLIVFTGGNPLRKPFFEDIIEYTNQLRIPFSVSPPGSELINGSILAKLKETGCKSISLSIDGADATSHEWLRKLEGSFDLTMRSVERIIEAGINIQINTTVMKSNLMELPGIAKIMKNMGIRTWELFFLINTGRGAYLEPANDEEALAVALWLLWLRRYGFIIRTVELPQYRVLQSRFADMSALDSYLGNKDGNGREIAGDSWDLLKSLQQKTKEALGEPEHGKSQAPSSRMHENRGFNGILFISDTGEVYPSGFLPISLGSLREDNLKNIISGSKLLKDLSERKNMKGACGVCNEITHCVGSRSRAFALTNDPLAEDPICFIKETAFEKREGMV